MQLYPARLSEKLGFEAIREAVAGLARSATGRERLNSLQPSEDRSVVERSLEHTREMLRLLQDDASIPLQRIPDIREFLEQARPEDSQISVEAFDDIRYLAATARTVHDFLDKRKEDYPGLYEVAEQLISLKGLEKSIKDKISEDGDLRDDASDKLRQLRNKLNNRRQQLRDTVNKVMSRAARKGMTSDEGVTIRSGRMVIPIRVEFKRKVQGFVHDVSASGQTVYLEPVEALNINNEIRQLEAEERREIERILRELTSIVRRNISDLEHDIEILARLDAILARAELGRKLDACVPQIADDKKLYLREAYNPHLMLRQQSRPEKEREEIIPLDLELDEDELCLMITGPNAGGKSVAMKTVGLCMMMLQSGLPIPVRDTSSLPLVSGLFVDIGDDQSIESDLSTFSSRLDWMHHTLDKAREGSLVLIDEAGAGTDPEEGGALFQSLAESLIDRGARVIITTHHGTLKVFANEHPKAVNGSMEFDQETLSPTYKFRKGIPGSSYAFEIARRMNLTDEVLDRARELVGSKKGKLESLIVELEQREQEAQNLRDKYEVLKMEMEAEKERYEQKRNKLNKESEQIRQKALKQAKEIMDSANQRIEQAVQRIVEQGKKDEEEIRKARRSVEDEKKDISKKLEEAEEEQEEETVDSKDAPEIGDQVRLSDGNTTGELVDVDGKQAVVQAGGLRLKTKYNQLVKVESRSRKKKEQKVSVNVVGRNEDKNRKAGPSLDIRGYRGPEAVKEVERYLDRVMSSGLSQVEIIHGKGEGILRKLVREYLERRKDIKNYHDAPWDQGGPGCTIVEF